MTKYLSQTPEEEDQMVENAFHEVLEAYLASNHRKKVEIIERAYRFAKNAHKGIRRRSGEPYILHPIAVAKIVISELGLGSTSICAALLHDVIEDTEFTREDIEADFGTKVADIVEGLTKISGGIFGDKASIQAENFRKLLLSMSSDIRVILIKMADRLHNMRTLGAMRPEKQYKIAGETLYIYAPLAHRLGLFKIKLELEDLAFKYEHPTQYAEIMEKLSETADHREKIVEEFVRPVRKMLDDAGFKYEIKARVKSAYSIFCKMEAKKIPFEEIYDIYAVRVIFDNDDDEKERVRCWEIYTFFSDGHKVHPDRLRDWISMPKANGYEALHSTVMGPDGVWVEVQIRTQRMEDIAERGFAAHWKYKHATISQDEDEFDKWLKQIRTALNSPTESAVDFLDNFKLSLYTSEIVVFTPKGESRKMPYGATALDFAYDIHSKIGNSAISAKINHKLEPITTQINNGDQIEIITADNARPKAEWLEAVTTGKAKQAIKSFLKRERQNNIERGMQLLGEKMKALNINLSGRVLQKIVPIYRCNNKEELYSKIGAGIISLDDLEKVLKINSKSKKLKFWTLFIPSKTEDEGDETDPNEPNPEPAAPEPQFKIAECCKPIPGDKVIGYRDPATGDIIVHKATCDELNRLASQYGKNIVKEEIKWSQHKADSYLVTTQLRGIDRMGLLLDLANVVSNDFNINIREVNIHSHDGIFEGDISLYVRDAESLSAVMDKLRKIKGIESVKRTIN